MQDKNKRVLWLLNHMTLMKTEVPILLAMGYEVFTPKAIPTHVGFRSASVNFEYDKSLTIPPEDLETLNAAALYTADWSDEVLAIMNRYFGAVFIMPEEYHIRNAMPKFNGAILLRAFGMEEHRSYSTMLRHLHHDALKWVYAVRDRFWFAAGYEQLHEVETPLLAERNVTLPIALPASYSSHRDSWRGDVKKILFVCPHIKTNEYYAQIYADFKRDFGDLPHIIVGAQKEPVDDPSVVGFVSDADLIGLYQSCAAMYYHSHEPRHVHYSPIEGMEIGTPVVIYSNNLAARMVGHPIAGAVDSVEDAHRLLASLVAGDVEKVEAVRRDQRILGELFSESRCLDVWKKQFDDSGLKRYLDTQGGDLVIDQTIAPHFERVPRHLLHNPRGTVDENATLENGIDFCAPNLPPFVDYIDGLTPPYDWGVFSVKDAVEIAFDKPLAGVYRIEVTGGASALRLDAIFQMEIGADRRPFTFSRSPWTPETMRLWFKIDDPVSVIRIIIPQSTQRAAADPQFGIGLRRITIKNMDGERAYQRAEMLVKYFGQISPLS